MPWSVIARPVFTDSAKVHRMRHRGEHFTVPGITGRAVSSSNPSPRLFAWLARGGEHASASS